MKSLSAIILAGGRGSRLKSLTKDKSKSYVSFMGKYRIIDFPLSSISYAKIKETGIITQYEPYDLMRYIGSGEPWDLNYFDSGISFLTPYECQGATMIGILLISLAPLVLHSTILYYPFNKKNNIKLVVTISLSLLAVGLDYLLFVANKKDLLGINFDNIMFPQLFVGSVVLIIGVSIYFIIARIIEILSMKNIKEEKEEKSHDQN